METAAVALTLGWGDPIGLLALSDGDWAVAVAVVNRAGRLHAEERKQLYRALGARLA